MSSANPTVHTSRRTKIVEREHGKQGRSSLIRRDCCNPAGKPRAAAAATVPASIALTAGAGPARSRQRASRLDARFRRPSTFTPIEHDGLADILTCCEPIRSKRNASFLPTSARAFPTHRRIGSAPSSRRAEIVTPSPYQPSPSTITSPRLTPKRTSIRFEADTADLRGQSPDGINDARELSQRSSHISLALTGNLGSPVVLNVS